MKQSLVKNDRFSCAMQRSGRRSRWFRVAAERGAATSAGWMERGVECVGGGGELLVRYFRNVRDRKTKIQMTKSQFL